LCTWGLCVFPFEDVQEPEDMTIVRCRRPASETMVPEPMVVNDVRVVVVVPLCNRHTRHLLARREMAVEIEST